MLPPDHRLRTDEERVAARVIEGEAIMIHLGTGVYYSTTGAGSTIWSLLDAGHSIEETARAVADRYGADVDRVLADVRALATRLLDEGLAVADPEREPTVGHPPEEVPDAPPYSAPVLERYDDLGALLALDPPLPGLQDVPWAEE